MGYRPRGGGGGGGVGITLPCLSRGKHANFLWGGGE